MVTVRVEVPDPAAREVGLNEQLTPVGSPVQDSATLSLKPWSGTIVIVEVAEFPAVTGVGERPEGTIWKSGGGGPAFVVFNITPIPLTPPAPCQGKMRSGRPSPFMSEIRVIGGGRRPLVGTLIRGPKVPSPFPNKTPDCEGWDPTT